MLTNCSLWCLYGLLVNDPPIFTSNAIGVVLSSLFITIFVTKSGGLAPSTTVAGLPLASTTTVGVHTSTQPSFYSRHDLPSTPRFHLTTTTTLITLGLLTYICNLPHLLALLCNIACLVLFFSPLSKLAQIIRAGYAPPGSIPIPFTLAQGLNCLFWTTHGYCTLNDVAVWFPNAFGLAAAAGQVAVIAKYGRKRRECFLN